jgi:hypothetical protein
MESTLDFHGNAAIAIYAPNGTMKTSFAKTFLDVANGHDSVDDIFSERISERSITVDGASELGQNDVVVFLSYDAELGPTAATSTLLVNATLRKEYESLQQELLSAREELLNAVKKRAGTRTDVAAAISRSITNGDDLFVALSRIEEELHKQLDAPFADVPYDTIFNDKVRQVMASSEFGSSLTEYVTRLNELLDTSKFFSRDTFSYYNASNVTKNLGDNKYFQARHTLTLHGIDGEAVEITDAAQLEKLATDEQQQITNDADLRKKMEILRKQLEKNAETRAFSDFVSQHVELLPELRNVNLFEEKLWKSYLKSEEPLFDKVVYQWRKTEHRKKAIEKQAASESTQWEHVIDIFNERFFVPFRLTAKNRTRVVLGQEPILQLGFEFLDGEERKPVEKGPLLEVLSNGELKALYILNVLFEVEARKQSVTSTLFVIDDLADSFDYKNKYAIVQYLQELTGHPSFRFIFLTHNFDFFRTLNSRGVAEYDNCLTAQKTTSEVVLTKAAGIRNPFVKDFKPHFFDSPMKRVASVPFMRNIVEYTTGEMSPDYVKLTSLLHWKSDSKDVTNADLDAAFCRVFNCSGEYTDANQKVIDLIFEQADCAASAPEGINFEHKIVLSMAIRLRAERHMAEAIGDDAFLGAINNNQTHRLHREYQKGNLGSSVQRKTLDAVVLMTPENLHINAFMYEPIIDMTDEHLKKLLAAVKSL